MNVLFNQWKKLTFHIRLRTGKMTVKSLLFSLAVVNLHLLAFTGTEEDFLCAPDQDRVGEKVEQVLS